MIGPSLYRINSIPLADDYNRIVDALGPLQNLSVAGNLSLESGNNGVSIIGNNSPGGSDTFDFPFKVESTSLSSAKIHFGRVFEEKNFKGDESIVNLSFIELSSAVTFDTVSGMNLQLNPLLSRESIIIALNNNADFGKAIENLTYQVCLSSDIPTDYHSAHLIANLTKSTSGATSWDIEQVIMGDYTFGRNPSCPFDITRYGDKWLIYLPPNSLVINGLDITDQIDSITYGSSPIVGYWYDLTTPSNNWLNIQFDSGQIGLPYQAYPGTAAASDALINLQMFSLLTSPTEDLIVDQILKGAQHINVTQVDSGTTANASLYKSLAVQETSLGVEANQHNYCLEMHGFKQGTEILGALSEDESYTHKIPIREEDTSTGEIVLRWTDVSSLSSVPSLSADFDFPFKTTVSGNIAEVIIGRVYEYNSMTETHSQVAALYHSEMPIQQSLSGGSGYLVGDKYQLDLSNETYSDIDIVVWDPSVYTPYLSGTYRIDLETDVQGFGESLCYQRIAKLTQDVELNWHVEQIHMGDVSFYTQAVPAFTIMRKGTEYVIYLPPKCLIINSVDCTDYVRFGLEPAGVDYWYKINKQKYSVWVTWASQDGRAGDVEDISLAATPPGSDGEQVEYPICIYDHGVLEKISTGCINIDTMRPDSSGLYSAHKSLSVPTTDLGFQEGVSDHTLGLHGFVSNLPTTIHDLFDDSQYQYTFAMREDDTFNETVELRYGTLTDVASGVLDQWQLWPPEITMPTVSIKEMLDRAWWDWYRTEQTVGYFWEQGEEFDVNHGVSIGSYDGMNGPVVEVINLLTRTLGNSGWNVIDDFACNKNLYVEGALLNYTNQHNVLDPQNQKLGDASDTTPFTYETSANIFKGYVATEGDLFVGGSWKHDINDSPSINVMNPHARTFGDDADAGWTFATSSINFQGTGTFQGYLEANDGLNVAGTAKVESFELTDNTFKMGGYTVSLSSIGGTVYLVATPTP